MGLGWYISRRISSETDYMIGGRSLGTGLATLSIFATWFGAETCVGAAGRVYSHGIAGSTHDPFGYGLCILFMGLFIARPLWRLQLTTIGDLFRLRFGPRAERLAALIMIPTSLLWAAAQIRAFGQILSSLLGSDVGLMIAVAAGLIVAYTFLGGLLADAWTDLLQGSALVFGLVVLGISTIHAHGWLFVDNLLKQVSVLASSKDTHWLDRLETWSVPVLGSMVAAELVTRAIASKTANTARSAALLAFILYTSIGLIPIAIGLMGAHVMPDLDHPEQILPMMALRYLPGLLSIVVIAALLSAILSTVDSALLTCGSLTSRNIIMPILDDRGISMHESGRLLTARMSVVAFGIISYLLAVSADGVYALVVEASSLGSAGLLVVVLFGLYSSWRHEYAALACLASGLVTYVLGAHVWTLQHPFMLSLVMSLVAYLGAGLIARQIEVSKATAGQHQNPSANF